jgi:FKBP-type peptidyl-prolyl cis-trans isomerase FkpA
MTTHGFTKWKPAMVIVAVFVSLLLAFACSGDEYDYEAEQKKIFDQLVADTTIIANYLQQNSLDAVKHPSWVYYNIEEAGSYPTPTIYSYVQVKYTGYLTNDSIFDSSGDKSATFQLGRLIGGWQIGLQMIGKGGKIRLYVPSYYGYGTSATSSIPANSVLIFDIELLDIL